MKKLYATMLLLVASFGSNVFAANPYTDCGIGAALFPNTNWAAVTSNVIWDAGTTAIISATASEDTCNGSAVKTAMLIHDKLESLETEVMSLTQGEVVAALMDVMSCSPNASLIPSLRSEMVVLLNTEDYSEKGRVEKAEGIYFLLNENEQVKNSCSLAS